MTKFRVDSANSKLSYLVVLLLLWGITSTTIAVYLKLREKDNHRLMFVAESTTCHPLPVDGCTRILSFGNDKKVTICHNGSDVPSIFVDLRQFSDNKETCVGLTMREEEFNSLDKLMYLIYDDIDEIKDRLGLHL